MAKAFTEQEKEEIRRRLQDEGTRQFKEKGLKKVSVRELTQAVGIAQGGFYSFYDSKEALLLDCVDRRMSEKVEAYLHGSVEQYQQQLEHPIEFLTDKFYETGMHLKENRVFNNLISDSVNVLLGTHATTEKSSAQAIKKLMTWLCGYWEQHGLTVTADMEGLRAFLKAAAVLFMNEEIIGREHFPEIYRSFVEQNTKRYFRVTGTFVP